jgi:protein TonB
MDCKDVDSDVRATCTQDGIMKHLVRHLQYPEMAREAGIEGRVFIRFVVEKTGEVRDVSVLRGVDPMLDRAAVQAVSSLPPFAPGRIDGRPVRVEFTLPVAFKLQ